MKASLKILFKGIVFYCCGFLISIILKLHYEREDFISFSRSLSKFPPSEAQSKLVGKSFDYLISTLGNPVRVEIVGGVKNCFYHGRKFHISGFGEVTLANSSDAERCPVEISAEAQTWAPYEPASMKYFCPMLNWLRVENGFLPCRNCYNQSSGEAVRPPFKQTAMP